MKKSILLLLTILMSISMNFYCFADNLNLDELTFVGNYDVIMQQSGNWAARGVNGVFMEGMLYEKENCIMLPLKTTINIENQNYEAKREAAYKKEETTAKLTLDNKEIIFFEGKRDVMIDGNKKRLYMTPDINKNDVFVSAEDLYILLNLYTRSRSRKFLWEKGSKQVGWYFMGDDGAHIREIIEENKTEYRLSTEYEGTLFEGKKEKNMPAYEKNGHFMIGWKDVSYFVEPKILLESVWEKETNKLFVKTWDGFAKDAIFQKDSNVMILNGVPVEMEEKAEIKNEHLYIPLTAMFQLLNIPEEDIHWIEKGKNVSILY